jgi:hypothetical protein
MAVYDYVPDGGGGRNDRCKGMCGSCGCVLAGYTYLHAGLGEAITIVAAMGLVQPDTSLAESNRSATAHAKCPWKTDMPQTTCRGPQTQHAHNAARRTERA